MRFWLHPRHPSFLRNVLLGLPCAVLIRFPVASVRLAALSVVWAAERVLDTVPGIRL